MVQVLTRHLLRLLADLESVLTDSALGIGRIRGEQLIGDVNTRESLDGRLGSRRGAVAVGIVLGQLLYELLEAGADEVIA